MGGVPVTMAPTGAPVPLIPVDPSPRDTRWLTLAVALAIAVLLLLVALILWI
jgi:hypothetical protein